mmetsp:Transcript_40393/g.90650  ORF Transcript_40393/g.90650 Transcript_40393/m.90650 type:complete len:288 (+) Transcript_40393:231-1094(+)
MCVKSDSSNDTGNRNRGSCALFPNPFDTATREWPSQKNQKSMTFFADDFPFLSGLASEGSFACSFWPAPPSSLRRAECWATGVAPLALALPALDGAAVEVAGGGPLWRSVGRATGGVLDSARRPPPLGAFRAKDPCPARDDGGGGPADGGPGGVVLGGGGGGHHGGATAPAAGAAGATDAEALRSPPSAALRRPPPPPPGRGARRRRAARRRRRRRVGPSSSFRGRGWLRLLRRLLWELRQAHWSRSRGRGTPGGGTATSPGPTTSMPTAPRRLQPRRRRRRGSVLA